jgi:hypothetical protein
LSQPPAAGSDTYSDMYEEVASKRYTAESVFGSPAPVSKDIRRARRAEPNFTTVIVKRRKFTKPEEATAKPTAPGPRF